MNDNTKSIIEWARKDAASKRNDWPGTPLTQISPSMRADLQNAVASGHVTIVSRPGKVDPTRTASFVVAQ